MKVCTKCGIEKEEICFCKNKARKDGLSDWCRGCVKEYKKEYYSKPEIKARQKEHKKEYYSKPEIKAKRRDRWKEPCSNPEAKDKMKEHRKEHRSIPEIKAKRKEYNKEYYSKPEIKAKAKEYHKGYSSDPHVRAKKNAVQRDRYSNPEVKAKKVEYQKRRRSNPEIKAMMREHNRKYVRTRCKTDPLYKLSRNLRSRIISSFKAHGYTKKSKTYQLIGIDFQILKNYLEYTWFLNYGTEYSNQEVEIDHVIPCASAKTEEELIALQHWTNLQYLTPKDNRSKYDYIPEGEETPDLPLTNSDQKERVIDEVAQNEPIIKSTNGLIATF